MKLDFTSFHQSELKFNNLYSPLYWMASSMKYTPLYKPNQIVCGTGSTVVVTGWTPRLAIVKKLETEQYAAIGNLYSPTRGISFLIRNLLYNPQVFRMLILSATREDKNAGGSRCLYDFFLNGFSKGETETGKQTWVINSDIKGYIDIEIQEHILNLLRGYIFVEYAATIDSGLKSIYYWHELDKIFPTQKPNSYVDELNRLTFPVPTISQSIIIPSPLYGHRIEGKTVAETWVKILHRIRTTGTIRPTGYDGEWQELINLLAVVTDEPDNFFFPEPNYLPVDSTAIDSYLPQILEDAPYTEGVKYTYGQRLRSWFGHDQIKQIITKLVNEIDAASAVANLWDAEDHLKGGSPCLNHIWVRVVENVLSLTAVFRSNDMFGAWVSNAMGLRALQRHILEEIGKMSDYHLIMGPLITMSQSAHIYDDSWENADQTIAQQYDKHPRNKFFEDSVGNFLIELNKKNILVTHETEDGELLAVYEGTSPILISKKIASHVPAISPVHIGYLGVELARAEYCLMNGVNYVQT